MDTIENGTVVKEQQTVILSDTTVKIRDCVRVLDSIVKDKEANASDKFYARKARAELLALLGNKVAG